ncbi:MAG: hypothetical protein L0H15_09245 [Nitrosospira sp.]|nr:hypothetical protein [Nitrosospira sp.]MDN5882003.1 hypothetical protein [Nitrosospira sp.]MDN5934800.1 hypothetical protein [Nitrosospira sp.]
MVRAYYKSVVFAILPAARKVAAAQARGEPLYASPPTRLNGFGLIRVRDDAKDDAK